MRSFYSSQHLVATLDQILQNQNTSALGGQIMSENGSEMELD